MAATLAVAVGLRGTLGARLILDRAAVMHGEIWRLWSGNWVHFGWKHLLLDLAVLVPAGIWAERIAPTRARWFLALAPGVIGLAVIALNPEIGQYGGLSGLAAGILALLALIQLGRPGEPKWFWWSVLALLGLKIGAECLTGHAWLAQFDDPAVRTVPVAHIAGVVVAAAVAALTRRI